MYGSIEMFIVSCIVFLLILIILWIFMALWVYSDAKKEDPSSAKIWLFVVLSTGPIGFVIYFLMKKGFFEKV